MRIIDLYCGAGGASMGYHKAGFEVIGVDIIPQPNYPFEFIRGDSIDILEDILAGTIKADAIHASPPCQVALAITKGTNAGKYEYPDLYGVTQKLMYESNLPGIIEHPSARKDVVLCGEMFSLGVIRHRNFELVGWNTPQPKHVKHRGLVRGWRHGVWQDGPYVGAYGDGGGRGSADELREAMDIPWMKTRKEMTEAIPPAYTFFLGSKLIDPRGKAPLDHLR